MDWFINAKQVFNIEKPVHFTNFNHCSECAEYDQALINTDIDSIGIEILGKLAGDPLNFCSVEGKKYYMPALIRLCSDKATTENHLSQLFWHLESDGPHNTLFESCTIEQREFISRFVSYLIETFPYEIDMSCCADEAFKVLQIWSDTTPDRDTD